MFTALAERYLRTLSRSSLGEEGRRCIRWAQNFWRWWSNELRGLVLDVVRRNTHTIARPHLRLPLENAEILPPSLTGIVPGTIVDLVLSDQLVMRRNITFPAVAAPHLRQAVTFLIERLIPFAPDQVRFAVRLLSRDRARKCLHVELIIVTRDTFDRAVDLLTRHHLLLGAVVDQNDPSARALDFDLRRQRIRQPFSQRAKPWKLVLAAALCVVVLGPMLLWWHLQENAHLLQGGIAALTEKAHQGATMRAALRSRLWEAEFLARQQRMLRVTEILNALSLTLPDETWLFALEITPETVTLAGYSVDVPAILTGLQQVMGFDTPSLRSPVSHEIGNDRSRFELQLRLVPVTRDKADPAVL